MQRAQFITLQEQNSDQPFCLAFFCDKLIPLQVESTYIRRIWGIFRSGQLKLQ